MNLIQRLSTSLLLVFIVLPMAGLAADLLATDTPSASTSQTALGFAERLFTAQAQEQEEFLPADEAFKLTVTRQPPNQFTAHWEIADGYYLYRKQFKFLVESPTGATLSEPQLPTGKVKDDEFFGRIEVYHKQVEAKLTIPQSDVKIEDLVVTIGYQGCAEAGICYPPIKKTIELGLTDVRAAPPPSTSATKLAPPPNPVEPTSAAPQVSEQDRIAGLFDSSGLLGISAAFFGFGLLLAFTPCVFPMIPILSSLIVGQGSTITTRLAISLSTVYVLAMAATYALAGVLFGILGANLQATLQHPAVLASFAALFVLLSLSMFGLYNLQLPASWQEKIAQISNRQQGGTLIGAAIMGFLSALIVGPCVAPPLAGALLYISQSQNAVLGGIALFALGLGMGTPLLIIGGSAGKLLPKAGAWMDQVKVIFGIALLGLAIVVLERVIAEHIVLFLWGLLLIGCAVYLGALSGTQEADSGWTRLRRSVAIAVIVYGIVLIVGGAVGGGSITQPLKGLQQLAGGSTTPAASANHLAFRTVKSYADLQQAVRSAADNGQSVLFDFYADWCTDCKRLERQTFADPAVQAVLANSVLLQADVTDNDSIDKDLQQQLQVFGPPSILFFGCDGVEKRNFRLVGFMAAPQFVTHASNALGC